MRQDYEEIFRHLEPVEPPTGLFEKIILAIKREQELQQTKRLLFGFLSLLIISFIAVPFSWTLLVNQVKSSGVLYFISTAVSDFGIFLTLWQNFGLAILESLPITGMIIFATSLGISVFTLRLFFYKRLLWEYLLTSTKLQAPNSK